VAEATIKTGAEKILSSVLHKQEIQGGNRVGRFSIDFEVANYADIYNAQQGTLRPDPVRRLTIRGVVDSGAAAFGLPQSVVKQLGLPITRKVQVRYPDGRRARRGAAQGAYVKILDRDSTFTAVVEPDRDTALIGAIVLEDLDLLVDCKHQRVIPRDPRIAIYEIE
jgi:predicted aspartyl protease